MTVRLLDLPGAEAIERRLKLNLLTGVKGTDHEIDRLVAAFISEVFGIYSPRPFDAFGLDDENDETVYIDVTIYDDDADAAEMIELWNGVGWDISTGTSVALCYRPLALDMVRLTSRHGLREDEGKSLMELEAMAWAAKAAPKPSGPSAQDRARNQAFLNLGSTRRRPAA